MTDLRNVCRKCDRSTAPWVDAILELWDSPDVYERHSRRALIEAQRWSSETLEPLYERFFAAVIRTQHNF